MTSDETDVVIVGAGPYGLSLATHLSSRRVPHVICGQPMKFWRDMPPGLNLKSLAFATSIYTPERGTTFPEWCRLHDREDFEPCTMESFAEYGLEMQRRFVPDLAIDEISRIYKSARGFDVETFGGRRISARRVVVATGLNYLSRMPKALSALPMQCATHTFDLSDYSHFRDKEVAVIGAGASAVEAGALVHEAGGRAIVLARDARVVFHTRTPRQRPLIDRIREPMTVLGAGRKHWVLQNFPLLVHFLPEKRRIRFVQKYAGPSSPWWITDRVTGKVPIQTRTEVEAAKIVGGRIRLVIRTDEGTRNFDVDHVVAGTGFEFDAARLKFLDPAMIAQLSLTERAPKLSMRFESSVEGLHFIGPMSAMSFGPLYRFVCGAEYTVPALARHLDRTRSDYHVASTNPLRLPLNAS